MTSMETLASWGGERDAFEVLRSEAAGPEAWSVTLRTTALSGNPGLEVVVRKRPDDERLWIQLQQPVPSEALGANGGGEARRELARTVEEVGLARHGALVCTLVDAPGAPVVDVRALLYRDGFSRDAVNARVCEVAKAARAIEERITAAIEAARMMADADRLLGDEEARVARYQAELERQGSATQSIAETLREAESRMAGAAPVSCPACNASNPAGSRFCGSCGASLACPACGAANPPGMRFCTGCGAALGSDRR